MSDLYLVLRSRLDTVVDWVTVGRDVMVSARNARGLSIERAARSIPVAAKTLERWEKRGQVPVYMLDRVAEVLDLEIERPERNRVTLADDATHLSDLAERVGEMREEMTEMRQAMEAFLAAFQQPADRERQETPEPARTQSRPRKAG